MMAALWNRLLLVSVLVVGLLGCEVTEEKIELWKGTQQGPKKLAGTLIDPEVDMNLRAKAAVALVEINAWDLFRESFQKMEPADSGKVVNAVSPILGEMTKGEGGDDKQLTKLQVDAKDGLFIMVDFAGAEGIAAVRKPLIEWATEGDYNIRAMAGQYNVKTVVKKLGAPAAEALTKLLALDQIVIEHVARLIREVDDEAALAKASAKIAEALKSNVKGVGEVHLVAAAIIGGEDVAQTLLDLATDKGLTAELQRFALRAYSQSVEQGNIKPKKEHLDRLFSMGENTEFDPYQREETYLVLAQVGGKEDTARVAKLLENEEFFWRLVGLRCLLRMDGEGQLGPALDTEDLARSGKEVNEIIEWVIKFPKLLPTVRKVLESGGPAAKAYAVNVLGAAGNAADAAAIEKLAGDGAKLPKVFEHRTVGEAAKAALEALKKKG
jgi:hypothetical protein